MKKESLTFLMLIIAATGAVAITSNENEQSFIAPLVEESLLLDISEASPTIVVGERGHILVSNTVSSSSEPNATGNSSISNMLEQVVVPTKATLTAVTVKGTDAWAVGHDASILKSTDAGQNWQLIQQAPELDRPLLDVHFFDTQEGIAIGGYGLFYRSEDGGETWLQEQHPSVLSVDDKEYLESIKDDEVFYLEELSFISPHLNRLFDADNVLYVAGEAGLIARSFDKGRNWERLDLSYQGSFFDVAQLANGHILAVGLRGNMFLLKDEEWQSIDSCVTTSLNSIVLAGQMVYVAGNNGVVLSIDTTQLNSDEKQARNSEGCMRHQAVEQIDTDFSDAISDAKLFDNALFLVTSGGLQTVALGE